VNALTTALAFLLDHPEARVHHGMRGQKKAAGLSWRIIARRVDALYREVLGLPQAEYGEPQETAAASAGRR
jgi:glycosyltransferase involved in cell wall biosynthesis